MNKENKKALIVATVIGFITSFEMNNIKLLQNIGYQVFCVSNMEDKTHVDKIESLKQNGVTFFNVPFSRSPLEKQNIQAYKELKEIMRTEQFDLVHCHTPVGGVLGRIAAHKEHVSCVIYTAHGFHFFDGAPIKNWVLFYPIEKFLSRWTDVLITINKEDYKRAKEKFHAKETIYAPGVGIDLSKFQTRKESDRIIWKELGIPQGAVVLLSVGEVNKNKNHKLIIESVAKLGDRSIHYVIAGSGKLTEEYKNLTEQLNIKNQVHFLGYRSDISQLDNAADIFAFPSIREGLGLAAIEALACGTPVIGMNTRGINEYVKDGITGFLFNNNVDSCCQAIVQCMNLRKDISLEERCVKEARKFDEKRTQSIMKKIYEE